MSTALLLLDLNVASIQAQDYMLIREGSCHFDSAIILIHVLLHVTILYIDFKQLLDKE